MQSNFPLSSISALSSASNVYLSQTVSAFKYAITKNNNIAFIIAKISSKIYKLSNKKNL